MERNFDVEKLPRKVKFYIEKLEADTEYYKKKVNQVEGKEETNTYRVDLMEKFPLPKNSVIKFVVGKSHINCESRDGMLHVLGNGTLNIRLGAGNHCTLTSE